MEETTYTTETAEAPTTTQTIRPYRGKRKVRVGRVVSNKMDKTVVVAVVRSFRHPLYGKTIRRTKKYMAHDEHNKCQVGDLVEIVETRPLSRHKRWRVRAILERPE
ncbi:30S ribosomal protein S17 [bacterium HR15]|uniref:30S ribosomal protein S17 n=1 Tax=uncultured prokaryote TaxID=198431 RepID=H5SJZ0_9ZZZZ|nr:30S ribosomal protein S17 [uncultured prokaryote]GBC93314.1 30S ribosomal protein S17 [bacterium HR15]